MRRVVFNGEFVDAETGETEEVLGWSVTTVIRRVRAMRDGDALVINASADEADW